MEQSKSSSVSIGVAGESETEGGSGGVFRIVMVGDWYGVLDDIPSLAVKMRYTFCPLAKYTVPSSVSLPL